MDEQRDMSSIFDQLVADQQDGQADFGQTEELPADDTAVPAQDGAQQVDVPAEGSVDMSAQGVQQGAPNQGGVSSDMPDLNQILGTANNIIQQQQQQIQQLMQQQQQAGQAVQQQSQAAQQAIEQAVLQPPTLDFAQFQYADDEQKSAMFQKYSNDMTAYMRSQMEREYAPVLQNYRQMEVNQANEAARSKLAQLPGFGDNSAMIDNIIAKTPELASIQNPEQRYQIAYLMAEGIGKINAPKPAAPTTDDILKMAMENPDVLKAIKEREAQNIAQQNQALPQFAATAGISSAPANVPKRPETMADAWNNIEQNGLRAGSGNYFAH